MIIIYNKLTVFFILLNLTSTISAREDGTTNSDNITNVYHTTEQSLDQETLDEKGSQRYSNLVMTIKTGYIKTIQTVGFVSNTLSLVIIIKQGLIKSAVWVYIASLAMSDSFAIIYSIIFTLSREPINYLGDILTRSELSCKINCLLVYFPLVTNHWILAIMTSQRSWLVFNPYKVPPSQKHAVTVVVSLVLFVIVIYGTFVTLMFGIVQVPIRFSSNDSFSNVSMSIKYCGMYLEYGNIGGIVMVTDIVVYVIIPAVLVIIANLLIVIILTRRQQDTSIQRDLSKVNADKRITRMLIFLRCYFVIMITPHALYYAIMVNVQGAFDPDNVAYNGLVIKGQCRQTNYQNAHFLELLFCHYDNPTCIVLRNHG